MQFLEKKGRCSLQLVRFFEGVFVFTYPFLPQYFAVGGNSCPTAESYCFLWFFSIFIFVILLFETFFKIVASYLSLFKLINSLTVEVSGILITIAG